MSKPTKNQSLQTLQRSSYVDSPTRPDNSAVETVISNTGTPIEVEFQEAGTHFSQYNETSSVAGLASATIIDYTVAVNKEVIIKSISASGENKAVYTVEVNNNKIDLKRSFYTEYNVDFNVRDLVLSQGDNLKVKVENKTNSVADFNSNFIGNLRDA